MTDGWRNEGTEEPRDLGMGLLLFRGREGGREVRREGGGGSEGERDGEGRRTDVGTWKEGKTEREIERGGEAGRSLAGK